MNTTHPRTSLTARSRRHLAALAVTGIVMTGALTACAEHDDHSGPDTTTSVTTDGSPSGTVSGLLSGADSPADGGGLTAPSTHGGHDGSSNGS